MNSIVLDRVSIETLQSIEREREIDLIFNRFSENSVLSFQKFCEIFSPMNKECLNQITLRINKVESNNKQISNETIELIAQTIKLMLNIESKNEDFRIKLNRMSSFNIREIFNKIDSKKRYYLNEDDVYLYLIS